MFSKGKSIIFPMIFSVFLSTTDSMSLSVLFSKAERTLHKTFFCFDFAITLIYFFL